MSWRPSSFAKDGYKEMHCLNCGSYLHYRSRLIDNKSNQKKCKCGTINTIYPPRKGVINGEKKIGFGNCAPGMDLLECTFTANQTMS